MLRHKGVVIATMIPIEYLWYIIGAVSVPVFILIYLKTLKRNRADKERVALRRRRFERQMQSSKRSEGDRSPIETPVRRKSPPIRKSNAQKAQTTDSHWLSGVKLSDKKGKTETTDTGHWLEYVKPKRQRHWLENLRRINRANSEGDRKSRCEKRI